MAMLCVSRPDSHQLVTFALLVHDLGWITMYPAVGIAALVIGLGLQSHLAFTSLGGPSGQWANQVSLLLWLIGNALWTCAEYIWDDGSPVGFLANIAFINSLDKKWYPVVMLVAITIQTCTCVSLIAFYLARCIRWRRHRPTTARGFCQSDPGPVAPLVGSSSSVGIAATVAGQSLLPVDACVLGPWPPLRMYYELFTLSWILKDTLWAYFNLTDLLSDSPSLIWVTSSAFFGAAAILIEIDCVRRLLIGRSREAYLSVAEGFWVTGNVVWMLQDSLTHWGLMYVIAVWLFLVGTVFVIFSFLQGNVSVAPRMEEDHSIRRAHAKVQEQEVEAVITTPKTRTRGTVASACKMRDFRRARLDYLNQRLAEWRTFMPRVHPYYAVRSHPDKKVMQLFSELQCGFACTTAEEVALVLSCGASPEGIIFSGARSKHLALATWHYIKEAGVRLIAFEDAAELRKVAALGHSTAQLLLQLAPSPLSPSQQRKEWELLLDLAMELGLHVSGVSLGTGPGREEYGEREEALREARKFFALAIEKGLSMELLDLGNVDAPKLMTFQTLTESIQEQLARWLPSDTFSTLRVIACPGQLFTSTLLTLEEESEKENCALANTAKAGSSASPNRTHMLSDGLYGGFAGALADRTQLIPPQAVEFEKQDQSVDHVILQFEMASR